MKEIVTLLSPRLLSFKNRGLSRNKNGDVLKLLIFGTIGVLFWGGIFAISLRVLFYFKSIEQLGDILAYKLLSMILVTFFSLLVFSSILTALSKLYLSRDLPLVHSMPVAGHKIFFARWIESTIDSAWMVVVYTLPVFIAYGIAFKAAPFFYVNMVLVIIPLAMIASGISTLLVMIFVMVIPASRIKNIFLFMSLCFFLILFFAVRLLRPERLVDPENFATTMLYLKALRTPAPPFLPSTWAFDSVRETFIGSGWEALFHTALLWSFAATLVFVMILVADAIYFKGVSKTQTASKRLFKNSRIPSGSLSLFRGPIRAFITKETKSFFRDQTQWPQLFLIGALVVIYVYNFNALPLEKAPIKTIYLQNLLSFLNMGLAAFVLTAIAARFAFPAVSIEREAFWIVKSGPVKMGQFLWIKFFVYFFPLLLITEILIVATNVLLSVTPFMMILSTITIFFIVPGVVSMGIGFGAAYPDFRSENPAQSVTSFGGVVFMMVCAAYIGAVIMLEAGPVYKIFMAGIRNESLTILEWAWTIVSFCLAFALSIAAIFYPMRFGEKKLSVLPV
jgi:ABC-2 type transport system permease protein